MKTASLLACSLALAAFAGCGSNDTKPPRSRAESLIEALTRGVKFDNGKNEEGGIAKLDAAAQSVVLESSVDQLDMSPGDSSIMPLDVDNPLEDNDVGATLLQFEGADSHTEVPVGDNASASDAGRGASSLHIENPFEVAGDICERLCNRRYDARLSFAVKLKDGSISKQGVLSITLDCREEGDPELCDDEPEPNGNAGSGSEDEDRDASNGQTGSPRDGGSPIDPTSDGGAEGNDAGAGESDGGTELPPQIGPLLPASATAGMALTLGINGTGFTSGATAYVDGVEVASTYRSATLVDAEIPASATANAGSLAVYVENVPGEITSRSNVLYLQVAPVTGAPLIYDYSPDNGVPGDTILIIASNLAGQTLMIEDAAGNMLEPGEIGSLSWPTAGLADTVAVVLPDDIVTGPITVSNSLGSYKGKIFSVGLNLTRAEGTLLESSTEFNTAQWSRASGGDNLLATSFFTAHGDCATLDSCTTTPFYQITFADPQEIGRIAMRGNREYASGYDFIRGLFEVLDADGAVLWDGEYDLPAPDRDLDITISNPVFGASAVRFTSLEDESDEPGFAELEAFAPE